MERLKVKEVTVVLTSEEAKLFKSILTSEMAQRGIEEVLDNIKSHRYMTCKRLLARFDDVLSSITFYSGDRDSLLTVVTLFILEANKTKDYIREKQLLDLAKTFQDTHRELGV